MVKQKNNYEFKSNLFKKIMSEKNDDKGEIKDYRRVNFTEVINTILGGASNQEIAAISGDINSGNVSLGMDSSAVNLAIANKDNDKVKKFIQNTNISLSIDVYGLDELSSEKFESVKQLGCQINKVYVNSGYDNAAKRGYSADVYSKMIGNAEAMSKKAMSKVKDGASEKDKFKAIYAAVIKKAVYDRDAEKAAAGSKKQLIAQNLQGYFVKGKCVCAGTADALVQLCKMNGIEAQYVQGKAKSSKNAKACDHAWVRVKIDGKWYNCDPTWDAYSNGKVLPYCMKSDADFKGHKAYTYKPTYIRNSNGRQVADKEHIDYEDADESVDISELEDFYDSEGLSESIGGRSLSSSDIAKYQGSRSIIDIIIDLLLNLGRRDSSNKESLRNKLSRNDLDKISKSNDIEDAAKKYADSLHVDTQQNAPQDISPKASPERGAQKRENPEEPENHELR